MGLNPYLAVSRDSQFFLEISADTMAGCTHDDLMYQCGATSSLRSRAFPSCDSAIFFNQADIAMKLCDLRYEKKRASYVGGYSVEG